MRRRQARVTPDEADTAMTVPKEVCDAIGRGLAVVGQDDVDLDAAWHAVHADDGPAVAQLGTEVALLAGGRSEDEPVHPT